MNEEIENKPEPKLVSITSDNSGGVSSVRILMLAWGLGVLIVWGIATLVPIFHGAPPIPILNGEVVTILLGIVGIKGVQRFGEK